MVGSRRHAMLAVALGAMTAGLPLMTTDRPLEAAEPDQRPLAIRGDLVYTMAGPPIAQGVVLIVDG